MRKHNVLLSFADVFILSYKIKNDDAIPSFSVCDVVITEKILITSKLKMPKEDSKKQNCEIQYL